MNRDEEISYVGDQVAELRTFKEIAHLIREQLREKEAEEHDFKTEFLTIIENKRLSVKEYDQYQLDAERLSLQELKQLTLQFLDAELIRRTFHNKVLALRELDIDEIRRIFWALAEKYPGESRTELVKLLMAGCAACIRFKLTMREYYELERLEKEEEKRQPRKGRKGRSEDRRRRPVTGKYIDDDDGLFLFTASRLKELHDGLEIKLKRHDYRGQQLHEGIDNVAKAGQDWQVASALARLAVSFFHKPADIDYDLNQKQQLIAKVKQEIRNREYTPPPPPREQLVDTTAAEKIKEIAKLKAQWQRVRDRFAEDPHMQETVDLFFQRDMDSLMEK